MKLRALVLVSALVLGACSDSTTNTPMGGQGTLTAVVNGTTFTALSAAAVYSGGTLAVAGGNAAATSVGFAVIPTEAGTGTYTVGPFANGAYSEGTLGWTTAVGGSGTFTITTLTQDRVVGTFEFVATPNTVTGATGTITVTSGAFDVPRTNQ